jgi:pimeloyl-ACP methyl ester carboxylesterase
MIVQQMAIDFPERVLSMTSIMSTTGNQAVGQAKPEAMAALLAPPPKDREEAIELAVSSQKIIGSTGFPLDETELRARSAEAYDRCFYPAGFARQMLAIVAGGDRTEKLAKVTAPTLVVHGEIDPLVTLSGGEATAAAIPGAQLLVVPGMGHDLPRGAWDAIVPAIVENAQRAAVA